jgi:uncharacterized membrane-anchored protein YhcB (DUF1043 family)
MLAMLVAGVILGYVLGRLDERREKDRILNLYLIAQKNGQDATKIRLQ